MSAFRTFEVSEPAYSPAKTRFITVFAPTLERRSDIVLYNGDALRSDLPVIYLLHGVYGSHWAWMFTGGVHLVFEQLQREAGLGDFVLAMPSDGLYGDGSGYLNRRCGRFEDWIVQDVRAAVERVAPNVTPASRHYIAGLSMGGYGAIRIGARHPHLFSGISGHSPITTVADFDLFSNERPDVDLLDDATKTDLAQQISRQTESMPPLRFDCGRNDILLESNRKLHIALTNAWVRHSYDEVEGGHDWSCWMRQIAVTFQFFDRIERGHMP